MEDARDKIGERARRVRDVQEEARRRSTLIQELEETLGGNPTHDELAAAAVKLHAEHAAHEDAAGHHERADAARERERRARNRADG